MHVGEVDYQGERFRAENPSASYKVGSRYVLLTPGDGGAVTPDPIFAKPPYLEVSDNMIFPPPGRAPFEVGTSLQQAKDEMRNLAETGGQMTRRIPVPRCAFFWFFTGYRE
jgi:hypothetical protein